MSEQSATAPGRSKATENTTTKEVQEKMQKLINAQSTAQKAAQTWKGIQEARDRSNGKPAEMSKALKEILQESNFIVAKASNDDNAVSAGDDAGTADAMDQK